MMNRDVALAVFAFLAVASISGVLVAQNFDFSPPDDNSTNPPPNPPPTQTRDIIKWPFAKDSIWNRPIGSGAQGIPAGIAAKGSPITADQEIISNSYKAPTMAVYVNTADWSGANRCPVQGAKLFDVPFPSNWVVPNSRENNGAAMLSADGRTYRQTQPVARCTAGQAMTSHYVFSTSDIYGDGIKGAHGGSGMSTVGGTLRCGELEKGEKITHALKCNLQGTKDMSQSNGGFRWPALKADSNYNTPGAFNFYGGKNQYVHMGSLLYLPPDVFNKMVFQTEQGKILAEAFRDYGCYVVDNTGYDGNAIAVAWESDIDGNICRFEDEFQKEWGIKFEPGGTSSTWSQDVQKIFTSAYVMTNNAPGATAGGGSPRVPFAPDPK